MTPAARPLAEGTELRPRLLHSLVACGLLLIMLTHFSLTGVLVVTLIASAFLKWPVMTLLSLGALLAVQVFQQAGPLALFATGCAWVCAGWLWRLRTK